MSRGNESSSRNLVLYPFQKSDDIWRVDLKETWGRGKRLIAGDSGREWHTAWDNSDVDRHIQDYILRNDEIVHILMYVLRSEERSHLL